MKLLAAIIAILYITVFPSQDNFNWEEIDSEQSFRITKSDKISVDELTIQFNWTDSLYTTHKGYYGGISSASFLLNNKPLQTVDSLKDGIGLGYIDFSFFDYNMDGFIDFKFVKSCGRSCLDQYYLFDNELQQFVYVKEWDYLRIQKIDKENRLILTVPELDGKQIVYKVEDNHFLIKK